MCPTSTLEDARQRQEDLMNYLALLQRQKRILPPDREEWACQEIKLMKKEIGKLDREIQRLMMEGRFKRKSG